jgi:DNA adenine methylase
LTTLTSSEQRPIPFLKWAGGKRWLVKSGVQIVPHAYNRFIEPFIGSGAVLFSLPTSNSIIADANPELTNVYNTIKSEWEKVEKTLKVHNRHHSDDYYYKVRSTRPRTAHTKAARFLYLNRTCFNGLYRVNLNGDFNVPRGTKNTVILESDDFSKISRHLKHCEIYCQDFASTIELARENDFVFVDPPYTVKHNFNGFVKYNEKIFSWEDQIRLKESIEKAVEKGVKVSLTNANHPSIHELYEGMGESITLDRKSAIAGNSKHRGKVSEVLMRFGWNAS